MAYTSQEVEERVMEDIVDRLRVLNFMGPWQEAADEIERLREALADIANIVNPYEDGDTMQEIARDALKEKE